MNHARVLIIAAFLLLPMAVFVLVASLAFASQPSLEEQGHADARKSLDMLEGK